MTQRMSGADPGLNSKISARQPAKSADSAAARRSLFRAPSAAAESKETRPPVSPLAQRLLTDLKQPDSVFQRDFFDALRANGRLQNPEQMIDALMEHFHDNGIAISHEEAFSVIKESWKALTELYNETVGAQQKSGAEYVRQKVQEWSDANSTATLLPSGNEKWDILSRMSVKCIPRETATAADTSLKKVSFHEHVSCDDNTVKPLKNSNPNLFTLVQEFVSKLFRSD